MNGSTERIDRKNPSRKNPSDGHRQSNRLIGPSGRNTFLGRARDVIRRRKRRKKARPTVLSEMIVQRCEDTMALVASIRVYKADVAAALGEHVERTLIRLCSPSNKQLQARWQDADESLDHEDLKRRLAVPYDKLVEADTQHCSQQVQLNARHHSRGGTMAPPRHCHGSAMVASPVTANTGV